MGELPRSEAHVPVLDQNDERLQAAVRISTDPEMFVWGTPEAIERTQKLLLLARELYEALKRAEPYMEDDYGQLPAMARYEQEVGE